MAARRLPSIIVGRRPPLRLKIRSFQHASTSKTTQGLASRNLVVFSTGILGGFVVCELFTQFRKPTDLSNSICYAASAENSGEEGDSEPKVMSRREKRFNQFASCEFEGQLLMTAQDFLESLTENEPKCERPSMV